MSMDTTVWSNGEFIPFEKATVHMLSHGFSRGSAVFEVFGIHPSADGPKAFRMDEHLKRLQNTCNLLGMELPMSADEMADAVRETVKINNIDNGHIKMMAYYSEVSLANLVPEDKLDLVIFAFPAGGDMGMDITKPISACISKWCKIHPRSVPPMAKACSNYLNGFLARQDAKQRGFDMGILLDTHGFVAEGSIESVFMVADGGLKTAPLGRVLGSISRMSIIELARTIGLTVDEVAYLPQELASADEVFVSATPFKVMPIGRLDERTLDAPGPISIQLNEAMNNVLAMKDDRFSRWFQSM